MKVAVLCSLLFAMAVPGAPAQETHRQLPAKHAKHATVKIAAHRGKRDGTKKPHGHKRHLRRPHGGRVGGSR